MIINITTYGRGSTKEYWIQTPFGDGTEMQITAGEAKAFVANGTAQIYKPDKRKIADLAITLRMEADMEESP